MKLRNFIYALTGLSLASAVCACDSEKDLIIIDGDLPIKTSTLYMVGDATPNGWNIDSPSQCDHEGLGTHRREVAADGRYAFVSQENHTPLILINSPYAGLGEFEITQADVYSALLDAAGLYNAYPWRGMGRSPFDTTYTGTSPSEATRAQTVGNLLFTQPALLGQ